jgi:hypothetical protein
VNRQYITRSGVRVVVINGPLMIDGKKRVACRRLTGGFAGWLVLDRLTPVTRTKGARR